MPAPDDDNAHRYRRGGTHPAHSNNLIDETIWQQLLDIARQCEQPYGFEPSRPGKIWLRRVDYPNRRVSVPSAWCVLPTIKSLRH